MFARADSRKTTLPPVSIRRSVSSHTPPARRERGGKSTGSFELREEACEINAARSEAIMWSGRPMAVPAVSCIDSSHKSLALNTTPTPLSRQSGVSTERNTASLFLPQIGMILKREN
jgi:hypothetical protein